MSDHTRLKWLRVAQPPSVQPPAPEDDIYSSNSIVNMRTISRAEGGRAACAVKNDAARYQARSRQRVPAQRERDGNRGQQRADGCKRNADLRSLVLSDQVGWEILENVL
jgi:hypothetical protein